MGLGYETTGAYTLQDADELLLRTKFDVVVSGGSFSRRAGKPADSRAWEDLYRRVKQVAPGATFIIYSAFPPSWLGADAVEAIDNAQNPKIHYLEKADNNPGKTDRN